MVDLKPFQQKADAVSARIDALDAEIAKLRERKRALAAERAGHLAELELQTKLRTLTPDNRRRITVTAVASGTGDAVK